ncbi:AraC family transcriptional regulator [Gordonia sp. N1V]|uniref:AraC family transcriptional regulator n=1 Tax=Gordonia sp. N1V TaxID=3034163 RepID=UPI0023E27607|nr:AraC family transcriptional regulator [Gordonia sp. N1V]MDF3280786.1 AraC family transcriptional regulator [Gordonia sp. N1V]
MISAERRTRDFSAIDLAGPDRDGDDLGALSWTRPVVPSTPLSNFELAYADDVDAARASVGDAFCRHGLAPMERADGFMARFHGVQLGGVGLYYLDYGASVRIDPTALDDFYLVQIPLSGSAVIVGEDWDMVSTPKSASVLQPDEKISMRWAAGNRQLLVRIDSVVLHEQLRKRLGRIPRQHLRFAPALSTTSHAERAWLALVHTLVDSVDTLGPHSNQLAVGELGAAVVNQLLLSQPHNYSAEVHGISAATPVPRAVRRAADLLAERADQQINIPDIADEVGLSVRSLQTGFRTHFETSPTEYLRTVRLERVRTALIDADATRATVADIALRWGFVHLGRFAATYRAAYGESPATTLRR